MIYATCETSLSSIDVKPGNLGKTGQCVHASQNDCIIVFIGITPKKCLKKKESVNFHSSVHRLVVKMDKK
jgi:hypothetical protein